MIHTILSKTTNNKINTKGFKEGEELIADQVKIAVKINSFFTNIGPILTNNIESDSEINHTHYLKYSSIIFHVQPID